MPNAVRDPALVSPVTVALTATGAGTRYDVGPGFPHTECSTIPWGTLAAGDVVNIHYRPTPYVTKLGLRGSGTAANRITIHGVTDASGNRPVFDGAGATTAPGSDQVFSATPAYGEALGIIVIKSGPGDAYGSYWPGFIDIQNIRIQGAADGVPWTDKFGGAHTYGSSAGVYILQGHDIRVRGCDITDNGFGVFTMEAKDTTPNWHVQDVEFSSCRVWGNGVSGSYLEHNFYVQAIRPRIFGNFIGRTRTGSFGSSYKSRSAGELFAYNTVLSSARALDFVHAEGQQGVIDVDPQYGETWCFGNVIINDVIGAGRGSIVPVHFGCDQSMEDGALGSPTITDADLAPGSGGAGTGVQRFAKRNLFFFNNTYINRVPQTLAYRTHLFDLSLAGTPLSPRTQVWEWNNAYHVEGDSNFSWVEYAGTINFMGGSKLVSPVAMLPAHSAADPARYSFAGTIPIGASPLGFTSIANSDYMPLAGQPLDGEGVLTPAGLPASWVQHLVEYMPNGVDAGGLVSRASLTDVGAFDNTLVVLPPPSGATMVTIVQKADLAPASFANNNTNAAGGITVRTDAGSTVKAAIDAAIAALPPEKYVTAASYDAATDTLNLTLSDSVVVAVPLNGLIQDTLAQVPTATDTLAGKVALANSTNYPAQVANDTDATTPAYVAAALGGLSCVDILAAMNQTAATCTDGTRGGFMFSSSVAADIPSGDASTTLTSPWAVGNLTYAGGGVQAPTPTVDGELRQLLQVATRTGPQVPSWLIAWAGDPSNMMTGPISYDANGAITSAAVLWPDGSTGVYTATTQSTAFPGSTDAYTVTYVGIGAQEGVNRTVTQPPVTRDGAGRVTVRPLRTVA